jgi:hypothetical protein
MASEKAHKAINWNTKNIFLLQQTFLHGESKLMPIYHYHDNRTLRIPIVESGFCQNTQTLGT